MLIDKFEQLNIDIDRQRGLDDHATGSEVVLPEWNAKVVVLPTIANSIDLASGRDASASENRDIVSPASGSIAPASGGPTPSGEGRLPVEDLCHLLPVGAMRPHAERKEIQIKNLIVRILLRSGCNAPARGNNCNSPHAGGRNAPACGGEDGGALSMRSVSFQSSFVVPPSITPG